jgi:hypothetical protein
VPNETIWVECLLLLLRPRKNDGFVGSCPGRALEAFLSRSALHRLVEEAEVAAAILAMLRIPGLCGADIDLSAGMIAPA